MKTIYKYRIASEIELPKGAEIIRVDYDKYNSACLWAIVETDRPLEVRHFEIFGIGDEIPPSRIYVGTIHDKGDYFWHIFEVKKIKAVLERAYDMYGMPTADYERLFVNARAQERA